MGNCFDAGGKLKFGLGDAPPAALRCSGVDPGAARSDKATHPSPGARGRAGVCHGSSATCFVNSGATRGDARLGDRENVIAKPEKVSARCFQHKEAA